MAKITINAKHLQRNDTAANWAVKNPILLEGELGYEEDTRLSKIGDGTTVWNNLAYNLGGTHTHTNADLPVYPTALPPSGVAGGDLSGSYPNPVVKNDSHTHDTRYYGKWQAVAYGDTIQNTNPFGGKSLYINSIDNALAAADKKYFVTATLHNKVVAGIEYPKKINDGDITKVQWEDSPIASTYPDHGVARLFDNSYESGLTIPKGQYAKISLNFSADNTAYFSGYPYGVYYLNYYYTDTPEKAQIRCYNGYSGHTIGYKTLDVGYDVNRPASVVQSCSDDANYYRRDIQFIIFAPDDRNTQITEIEWKLARPNFSQNSPILSKYGENNNYYPMTFGDHYDKNKVVINPNGNVTATNFIGNASTSTKLLTPRAINGVSFDGSVDITVPAVDQTARNSAETAQNTANSKEPAFNKNNAFNKAFGNVAGTVCQGNDARLSDARPANGGISTSAYKILEADTRGDNKAPEWYMSNHGKTVVYEFKFTETIGLKPLFPEAPAYCEMSTYTSWGDASGNRPVQLVTCDTGLYFRTSASNTAWNAWQKIWTGTNDGGNATTVGGKSASDFLLQTDKVNKYCHNFAVADWGSSLSITIPFSLHKINTPIYTYVVEVLVGGKYRRDAVSGMDINIEYDSNKNFIITSPLAINGRVMLIG